MNWQTLADEPEMHLQLKLGELRHVIAALMYTTQDETLTEAQVDMNDGMIELLLQIEADMVKEMNANSVQENWVRENGEV